MWLAPWRVSGSFVSSIKPFCAFAGGYAQRIFVKQVTKVLEDLLAALKTQE